MVDGLKHTRKRTASDAAAGSGGADLSPTRRGPANKSSKSDRTQQPVVAAADAAPQSHIMSMPFSCIGTGVIAQARGVRMSFAQFSLSLPWSTTIEGCIRQWVNLLHDDATLVFVVRQPTSDAQPFSKAMLIWPAQTDLSDLSDLPRSPLVRVPTIPNTPDLWLMHNIPEEHRGNVHFAPGRSSSSSMPQAPHADPSGHPDDCDGDDCEGTLPADTQELSDNDGDMHYDSQADLR